METERIPENLRTHAVALSHLEAALIEQTYSNPAAAGLHIAAARQATGFEAELSGLNNSLQPSTYYTQLPSQRILLRLTT